MHYNLFSTMISIFNHLNTKLIKHSPFVHDICFRSVMNIRITDNWLAVALKRIVIVVKTLIFLKETFSHEL